MTRARTGAVLAVCALAAIGGASAASGRPALLVDRPVALADRSVRIAVVGLRAHALVTIGAETTDAGGRVWRSRATFRADRRGRVELAAARPLRGSYSGAAAMGLFWSLLPAAARPTEPFPIPPDELRITLTVRSGGRVVARRDVVRTLLAPGVVERDARPTSEGLYGDLYLPADAARTRKPAVLLFAGSGGGLSTDYEAALLAAHGFPALALAYFGEPGLPPSLSRIPLEYFARALRWLAAQPGVDPERLVVDAISRGSEAALLLGVHYPDLVRGVVALVPSNVAICSFPGCGGPAWLLGGVALPFTRQFDDPAPTDDPAAVIPVERIRGPLLLACAGADAVWVSCRYAHAIVSRLLARHARTPHILLDYPAAGHELGYPVPFLPGRYETGDGRTPDANARARAELWPRLLAFLDSL